MTYSAGDIVLSDFPFSDGSAAKQRPVLLLTDLNSFGDFVAAAVTSQSGHADAETIAAGDCASGGLPRQSFVRCRQIFSFNASVIVKSVAKLKPAAMQRVRKRLCPVVGCA